MITIIVPLVPPAICAAFIELPLEPEVSELLPTTDTHIIILINNCSYGFKPANFSPACPGLVYVSLENHKFYYSRQCNSNSPHHPWIHLTHTVNM